MERRHVAGRVAVPHQPDVSSLGGGGKGTARTPPLQQQAAPNPTKSRISNDLRASSEFVAIQGWAPAVTEEKLNVVSGMG